MNNIIAAFMPSLKYINTGAVVDGGIVVSYSLSLPCVVMDSERCGERFVVCHNILDWA